jgi:hypothetical protein
MKCNKCGTEIKNKDKYCPECGKKADTSLELLKNDSQSQAIIKPPLAETKDEEVYEHGLKNDSEGILTEFTKKTKRKKIIAVGIIIICAVIIIVSMYIYNENQNRNKVINNCISVCKSYGLENIVVTLESKDKNYGWYFTDINSSNFSELTTSKMYDLDEELHKTGDVFINEYTSNGDRYTIFRDDRQINKNSKLISGSYSSSSNSGAVSSTVVTDDEELGAAWALAIKAVKSQLKSSSSAKFPSSYGSSDVSITNSGDTYTVKAWVEAENSLGGTEKRNFTVQMTKSGSGQNVKYTTSSCNIAE